MYQCNGLTNHAAILNAPNSPDQGYLQEGDLCEILPVGAALPSVRQPPVFAARDWDLNYSQREKEKKLTQVEKKVGAVS